MSSRFPLPSNWSWTTLGELLSHIEAGHSPKAENRPAATNETGVLKVSAVSWGEFLPEENKALPADYQVDPNIVVRKGDLLISRANTVELVGAVALVRNEHPNLLLSDKTLRLVPALPELCREFLLYALRMPWVRSVFEEDATGTSDSMRNLSQDKIRSAPIPLPPLAEQRRIISKLESLLARSRRAKEALDAIPALLEKFRQSVLAAAFRGDLTADWREQQPNVEPASKLLECIRTERRRQWEEAELEKMRAKGKAPKDDAWKAKYEAPQDIDASGLPQLPNGWCWTTAEEVVEPGADIVYGIVQPGPEIPDGVPYVRGMDIEDGRILESQLRRTHPDVAAKYARAALKGGDILLGIIRATKVAIVPPSLAGANITQGTARFRPATDVNSHYLAGWLSSPDAQSRLHAMYRGIDIPGLNLRDVRRLPVPLAPAQEQLEIERLLLKLFERESRLRALHITMHEKAKMLDTAIFDRAFRGELVPQDPNDEPASVLLERIRAEREAAASSAPKRPRGRRPAA